MTQGGNDGYAEESASEPWSAYSEKSDSWHDGGDGEDFELPDWLDTNDLNKQLSAFDQRISDILNTNGGNLTSDE